MTRRDVFISHIVEEKQLAIRLADLLREHYGDEIGVFASSDIESVAAGTQWLQAIETALVDARVVIVLCSKESVLRPWIYFETGAGWIKGIPVIPLCHSGLRVDRLAPPLGSLQAIELHRSKAVERLFHSLGQHLGLQAGRDSVASAASAIAAVITAERQRRRYAAIASIARSLVGLVGLLVGPIAVAAIYALSLSYYDGNAESAGEILRFTPLPIIWYFGTYFRLSRQSADLLDYVLAPIFIALLSGALSSVVYARLAESPSFEWIFAQKWAMATFVVSTALSFVLGIFLGEWFGRMNLNGAWFEKPLRWLFPGAFLSTSDA